VEVVGGGKLELSNHLAPQRAWYCPEMMPARDGLQIGAVT
jgi:hypothetical protein